MLVIQAVRVMQREKNQIDTGRPPDLLFFFIESIR